MNRKGKKSPRRLLTPYRRLKREKLKNGLISMFIEILIYHSVRGIFIIADDK